MPWGRGERGGPPIVRPTRAATTRTSSTTTMTMTMEASLPALWARGALLDPAGTPRSVAVHAAEPFGTRVRDAFGLPPSVLGGIHPAALRSAAMNILIADKFESAGVEGLRSL